MRYQVLSLCNNSCKHDLPRPEKTVSHKSLLIFHKPILDLYSLLLM